jgi:hypothetical protein
MSSDTPVGFTLRSFEESLAAKSSAAAPNTEAKRTPPTVRPSQGYTVVEPDAPTERLIAKKKTPAPAAAPKPPSASDAIILFNLAYEVLRNAKAARDIDTPDLAYELYSLDIADRRDWEETTASLIDFIKVNQRYLLSADSKTRWTQQFGQGRL